VWADDADEQDHKPLCRPLQPMEALLEKILNVLHTPILPPLCGLIVKMAKQDIIRRVPKEQIGN